MVTDTQYVRNQDLVLRVSPNVDPAKLDMTNYEDFLDALCGDREYQKEAIRETLRFLLGGQYDSLSDLANETYRQNIVLNDMYPSIGYIHNNFQLP